jgi:guanosine-3',5'-bis(diphosphate) 3'-pyrophosphohydrolase
MKLFTDADSLAIQEALEFLVLIFQQRRVRNRNKPVVLHSLRVGMHLYDLGYPKDIVISGSLHDVLEDTDFSDSDMENKFGVKVARIVRACSFDPEIKDKQAQYEELFSRCLEEGKNAVLVKIADLLDNLPYMLDKNTAEALRDLLRAKIERYINLSRPLAEDEPLFRELEDQFKTLSLKD